MKSCCEAKSTELVRLREKQAHILRIVLLINAIMFVAEFSAGLVSRSSALLADSLDMLGDAVVYGFGLYVLHKSERMRATAALLKGIIIFAFGIGVLVETIRRAFGAALPIAETMGIVGFVALAANAICLVLLTRHKDDDLNMRSTWTCSRNDIISNSGVLLAAGAVWLTGSKWPDIIIGIAISAVFLRSASSILVESVATIRHESNPQVRNLSRSEALK